MKKPTWTLLTALMVMLALLAAPALSTQAVQAAGPFTVTTTFDSLDAAPGNGVCANAGGFCSLRAAIEEANASSAPTTINLPAGTYNLTLGALDVAPNGSRTIVINGSGPASTIIQQTDTVNRVMAIDYSVMGNTNVTLSGVTLTGGSDTIDHYGGAGILAGSMDAPTDSLTLSNCIVSNNNVAVLDILQGGGGVRMDGGILTVANCTFTNNSSGLAPGGAIAFYNPGAPGTLTISGSTFTNNHLTNTSASGPSGGGAVYINKAIATISNSTFNANQASSTGAGGAHGGAVYFNTGTLTIDHSTFFANIAAGFGRGGAIYVDSGTLSLTYSRIYGNQAYSGGSGVYNHALNGAATTATNNWWGCNAGPAAAGCDQAVTDNGALTATPWIVLTNSASPNVLHSGGSATLTASFRQNSNGQPLSAADVSALQAKPLAWTDVVNGSLTNQQTVIGADGQATATFTAGSTLGTGGASAQFDHAVVPATLTVIAEADLAVTKTGPAAAVAGNTITYTVTLSNNGPDAAPLATLTDALPAGLSFVSQQQTAGPTFMLANTGNTINNSIVSMAAGTTASFEITAAVSASVTPGSTLSNTASASLSIADPVPGNNSATANSTVYVAPAITSGNAASFTMGTPGSFTVTASGYPTPAISQSGTLPTGVTFVNNGDGTATLAGTPAPGTAGSYPLTITASNASGIDASQNFTLTVQKTAAAVSVTADINPSVFGQAVSFTATVTSTAGTPTGVVQFTLNGGNLGAPVALADGIATFTVTSLVTGLHTIGAAYDGDANFAPAGGTLPDGQTVNPADTTTTLTASLIGSLFRPELLLEALVVQVAPGVGVPTGTVTFTDGVTTMELVTLDATGYASVVVSGIAPGGSAWTATYNGDSNFTTSNHTVGLSVPFVLALPMISR